MIHTSVKFQVEGGGDPAKLTQDLITEMRPTVGDLLYAGQRQRTRILERTAHGVDVNNAAFAPYSTKHPYYWNPSANKKGLSFAKRQAAVNRLMTKLTGRKGARIARDSSGKIVAEVRGMGDTIRFKNYAAFKSFLGRTGVDLRGPRAPHMLQAIIIRVRDIILRATDQPATDNNEPADEIRMGIYGDEAGRARGHNEGVPGRLPQRKFMGANETDKGLMVRDIVTRMMMRINRRLRGGK